MRTRLLGTIALGLAAAGCSNSLAPTAADQELNQDVALVAADAALDDVAQMVVPNAAPQLQASFEAVPFADVSRTVTFFDTSGVEQTAYDPNTTASVRIQMSLAGDVQRSGWTASITRTRDITVSGLEGQETSRTWNGTGTGTIMRSSHTDGTGSRTYDMSSSATITDVVVGVPRSQNPWPLSGSITRSITVTITRGDRTETRTRTVTITFNGTQFATLTVGDETFEVDLAARAVDRPTRRR